MNVNQAIRQVRQSYQAAAISAGVARQETFAGKSLIRYPMGRPVIGRPSLGRDWGPPCVSRVSDTRRFDGSTFGLVGLFHGERYKLARSFLEKEGARVRAVPLGDGDFALYAHQLQPSYGGSVRQEYPEESA